MHTSFMLLQIVFSFEEHSTVVDVALEGSVCVRRVVISERVNGNVTLQTLFEVESFWAVRASESRFLFVNCLDVLLK
jgi:hypothetical protein